MRLYLNSKKGKKEFLDVKFWSFMKCYVLGSLALMGILYGAMFIIIIIMVIIAALIRGV